MRLYMNGVPIDVLAEDHMGVLTQAEYDALPEEKAKQGLYVIPDDGGTLAGVCDIYSTEETVVGRWIDGKPIYSKTVYLDPTPLSDLNGFLLVENVDILVNQFGVIRGFTTRLRYPFPFDVASEQVASKLNENNELVLSITGSWSAYTFYATFKYTKTTDEATI